MDSPSPVSKILTQKGIPHLQFTHPGPIRSLEQAAEERGQSVQQIVRSILFRLAEDEYAMVLIAGPSQVSWKALRKYFGQSRLTMASAEEVLQITGYELGAVSPFGIPPEIPILIDQTVLSQEEVSLGSGKRGTTVILSIADLQQVLGDLPVVDFARK